MLNCRSARHDGSGPLAGLRPARPYNALPALPPAADIESRAILRACIEARAALAALKAAGSQLPNQTVLINTLPLMEAQASSEIENIVTTADALFRQAQLNERTADPATREALRETFDVPPELEAELLESIAQADRGETISADEVIERLRRIT